MELYTQTAEFWQNMLCGILMGLSACLGLWCIRWIETCDEFDTDLRKFAQIVVGVILMFIVPVGVSGWLSYEKLKEGKRGPVMVLRGISPQLYNHFMELERIQNKERKLIGHLQAEQQKATSVSAQELYERKISETQKRQVSINNMLWRINNLATEMYFSNYLTKLEQHTTSDDFQAELQEIKHECDVLMRLHTPVHE